MTARVTLSDGSTLTIRSEGKHWSRDDPGARVRYRYTVKDGETGAVILTGNDLHSGCGAEPDSQAGMTSLLSFLGATYECGEMSEQAESYPTHTHEWLERNAEECMMHAVEREDIRGKYAVDIREDILGDTRPANPDSVLWVDSLADARESVWRWIENCLWVREWIAIVYHGSSWDGVSFGDVVEAAAILTPGRNGGIHVERP